MNIFSKYIHKSTHLHPLIKICIRYRYIVFLVAALGIWIDAALYTGVSLIAIYSLISLYLGLVYRSVGQGILNTFFVTFLRFFCSPNGFPEQIEVFFFQWLSYFAIWFAVSTLIKMFIEQKENLLRFTTTLAKTLDSRDKYTAFHSENVANYSVLIAKQLGLSKTECRKIELGAKLHDIGKIGIPESILNKPGKLTSEEYEIIKSHTTKGYEMVNHIKIFEKNDILDAILYHHEREDGSGYPEGLAGERIPVIAKIIAVADSFDAMTSSRIYRETNSRDSALSEIKKGRGIHYDAQVVDAFLECIDKKII
ncbi:HD-GYP domain-containing protein [Bacillus sp. AK031]